MSPLNHSNGHQPAEDDFWRTHDEMLGVASSGRPLQLAELERQLQAATTHAAVMERRAAELDAALRATVEAFRDQLADLECDHERRLTTIRAAAHADAQRIMDDAQRREADLMAEIAATRTSWSADAT